MIAVRRRDALVLCIPRRRGSGGLPRSRIVRACGRYDDKDDQPDPPQSPSLAHCTSSFGEAGPLLKMLFGIFTCTPIVPSTSCVIATSPAMLVS